MTRRSAVLLTSRFPFGASEFLEAEVEHLCREFDEVRLVPIDIEGSVRPVPSNAIVDVSFAHAVRSGAGRFRTVARQSKRVVSLASNLLEAEYRTELTAFGLLPRRSWATAVSMEWAHAHAIRAWARKVPTPDLAYSFWLGPATIAMRCAWPRATVIARGHGGDIDGPRRGFERLPFLCESTAAADRVFSVSEWGKEVLVGACPAARDRVGVARLGSVDVGGLCPQSGDGVLRILSVSSVDANKRVGLIGAAANAVARSGRTVSWRHIGDGPLLERVRAQVRRDGTAPLSAHLDGAEPLEDVLTAMRLGPWDAFVNASQYEGAPVSVMEAQSAGIPCVVTAVCGTPEIVDSGMDIHVPRDVSATELGRAIVQAAASPPELAAARRSRWSARYNRDANAKEFVHVVSELVANNRV